MLFRQLIRPTSFLHGFLVTVNLDFGICQVTFRVIVAMDKKRADTLRLRARSFNFRSDEFLASAFLDLRVVLVFYAIDALRIECQRRMLAFLLFVLLLLFA